MKALDCLSRGLNVAEHTAVAFIAANMHAKGTHQLLISLSPILNYIVPRAAVEQMVAVSSQ
jgi:hypothetical protein